MLDPAGRARGPSSGADRIAVFLRVRLTPTGSSAAVENRIDHLWTLRDGRATRLQIFPRSEDALEAVERGK